MSKHILLCNRHGITNEIFYKDVVLIPAMFHEIYGFRVTIISSYIGEEILNEKFKYINGIKVENKEKFTYAVNKFLLENAMDIDILFFHGPYLGDDLISGVYKKINPNGKIYLKLDLNRYWLKRLENQEYFKFLLKISDLITVEDKKLQKKINDKFNCEVEYSRNGFIDSNLDYKFDMKKKENRILNVGRLFTNQKATEILIEAFLKADLPNWELRLVGKVSDEGYTKIEKFKDNPKFKKQVKFLGFIKDKEILNDEYKKAKIAAMSSTYEGCAHVYIEAAVNRCYIISTDVDGITDLTKDCSIVPINDVNKMAAAFEDIASNEELMDKKSYHLQQYVVNECNWKRIVQRLYLLFCVKGII